MVKERISLFSNSSVPLYGAELKQNKKKKQLVHMTDLALAILTIFVL